MKNKYVMFKDRPGYRKHTKKSAEFKELTVLSSYRRTSTSVPTKTTTSTGTETARKDSMSYSGSRKLLGIAVMHKSNLVPVFEEQEAKELARMRR